ncbi:hypothetical protein WJX73_006116 [Symbiochloris irregularis]|uniref:Uncharacterized protein n=1 Tax=Symbiochloris irregularis TaxID=706552 RepID=A0AAW1NM47_9CHLO
MPARNKTSKGSKKAAEREMVRNSMGWSPETPDSTVDQFLEMQKVFGGGFTPPDRGAEFRAESARVQEADDKQQVLAKAMGLIVHRDRLAKMNTRERCADAINQLELLLMPHKNFHASPELETFIPLQMRDESVDDKRLQALADELQASLDQASEELSPEQEANLERQEKRLTDAIKNHCREFNMTSPVTQEMEDQLDKAHGTWLNMHRLKHINGMSQVVSKKVYTMDDDPKRAMYNIGRKTLAKFNVFLRKSRVLLTVPNPDLDGFKTAHRLAEKHLRDLQLEKEYGLVDPSPEEE